MIKSMALLCVIGLIGVSSRLYFPIDFLPIADQVALRTLIGFVATAITLHVIFGPLPEKRFVL